MDNVEVTKRTFSNDGSSNVILAWYLEQDALEALYRFCDSVFEEDRRCVGIPWLGTIAASLHPWATVSRMPIYIFCCLRYIQNVWFPPTGKEMNYDDVGGCCPCRNQNFSFGKLELTTACSTSHTYIAIFPDIHIAQVIPHIAGHHFFQIVICPSVREICVNISSPQLVVGIHASGSGLVSRRWIIMSVVNNRLHVAWVGRSNSLFSIPCSKI